MYKLVYDNIDNRLASVVIRLSDDASIPFDPANTDYAKFKLDLSNGAELQDADGNVMTAEQVQAFLSSLP